MKNKPRAHVPFNTGTRVHPASKGKGSYDRRVIHHEDKVMESREETELLYEHGAFHDDAGCDNHIPGHE